MPCPAGRPQADDRARVLRRFADLVADEAESLGDAHLAEAASRWPRRAARWPTGSRSWPGRPRGDPLYGELVPAWHANKRIMVLHQPVGVTAGSRRGTSARDDHSQGRAGARVGGAPRSVKPASQTPLTAIELGRLAVEAGGHPDVLNVITGTPARRGDDAVRRPRVRKVSFNRLDGGGQQLIALSAANVTRLSLELGGHAPTIVFDDTDLSVAVAGVLRAKFRNNGQSCIAANRIYVQAGIYDDSWWRHRGVAVSDRPRRGGDGRRGPAHRRRAVAKVQSHVDDRSAVARTPTEGGFAIWVRLQPRFYEPTVSDRSATRCGCHRGDVRAGRGDHVVRWANAKGSPSERFVVARTT